MKQKSILALCGASALASTTLHAADRFWDGTGANWGVLGGWSTGAGVNTDPAAIPGLADVAFFNTTALVANQTISLALDRSVLGINFTNTAGTKTLQGGGTNRILTLGTSGINVVSGSGAVTIGSAAAGQAVAINMINSQSWINNSATTLTIANGVTRSAGAAVSFSGSGTITAANAFTNNSAGIVGTWATFGTAANAKYATKNGSNILGAVAGTVVTTATDLTDTTGLVNYDLAATTGSAASTFSANTIRYTGAASTLAPGATSFSLNGLLNAGTGELTVGTNKLTIGADKELVINAANAVVTISSIIENHSSGDSILTKTGGSALTLTGTNTYNGGTNITGGNLILANTSGTAIQGPITIGGNARLVLGGSNQISDTSVITFASGNNAGRFNMTNAAGTNYIETIGGIADATGTFTGNRIVESATDSTNNSPAILTINTNGSSHTFGGFVRDAASGAVNSALSIVKDGLGTQTFTGSVTYTGSTTVKAGTLRLSSVINNSAISLEGGVIEFTGAGTRSLAITSPPAGGGVIKSGTGILVFQGDNTYTGTTTVNAGTLELANTGALSGTTNVTVGTGGILLLSGTGNAINNAATFTLGGGTLRTNNATTSINETAGTMVLTSNSFIDFGGLAGGNTLSFANSSANEGLWSGTLNLWNWSEGMDHLFFGSDNTGLTSGQLNRINLYSDGGTNLLGTASINALGEIIAVPEPSAALSAMGLLALLGYQKRRYFLRCPEARNLAQQ